MTTQRRSRFHSEGLRRARIWSTCTMRVEGISRHLTRVCIEALRGHLGLVGDDLHTLLWRRGDGDVSLPHRVPALLLLVQALTAFLPTHGTGSCRWILDLD